MRKTMLIRWMYVGMITLLLQVGSACTKFTEVDLPKNQLTSSVIFQDRATADAAMAAVYAKVRDIGMLQGGSPGIAFQMGCYSDELDFYGGQSGESQFFYTNSLLPSNGTVSTWWSAAYNVIYAANAVIEGVEKSQALAVPDKDRLMGEALFVRALFHFYLVNLFGPVPYANTTDYRVNGIAKRMATSVVYQHLEDDLLEAQRLLQNDYTYSTRITPNKAAANALLARVYLFNQNWSKAEEFASMVISDDQHFQLEMEPGNTFLKESRSTIWQLITRGEGQNTAEGEAYIFTTTPPPTVALTESLIAAFEPGDLRKNKWIGQLADGSNEWYYAHKYKQRGIASSSTEYSIILRLAEQYLVRAEARARLNNLTGAKNDLNEIRKAAGLFDSPAQTQGELLSAIMKERRVELFTEGAHRFLDLKRTGTLVESLRYIKPGFQATDSLLPIPETELLVNSNLSPQNAGY